MAERYTVDLAGKWALYAPTLPEGADPLGTVTRGNGDTGALARIGRTGAYVQVNAGAVRALDGRKVAAALGSTGRPVTIDARRVNVTLDEVTIEQAKALGAGNLSAGLREAVRIAQARTERPNAKS